MFCANEPCDNNATIHIITGDISGGRTTIRQGTTYDGGATAQ